MRTEAEASALTLKTTSARDQMEAERDGAVAEAVDQRQRREAAEQAAAAYDDKSLAAIVQYLAPGDGPARARADALLKVKSLNALPTSAAALETESQRNEHYKRSIRVLADSLIHHVADGQTDRIELLESAVTEHLAKNSRKRARESASAADRVPPVEPLLQNLADMWRNAKKTRDYVGAKQALSLLLLPAEDKTKSWTHADIIELASDIKPVNAGDRVLVNRGRNTRGVGVVLHRNSDGNGNMAFSIGPVDVPPRSRRSCGSMANVPARDVEHFDSLICRPGEVRGSCEHTKHTHPRHDRVRVHTNSHHDVTRCAGQSRSAFLR